MKIIKHLILVLAIALTSCMGDEINNNYELIGQTYEVQGSFVEYGEEYGNFNIYYKLPNNSIIDGDAVLVYALWGNDGGYDIWVPLPKTIYRGVDVVEYSYDYTLADVSIYLFTTNEGILDASYLDNQIFRIVVVPAKLMTNKTIDLNSYESVINGLNKLGYEHQYIDTKLK